MGDRKRELEVSCTLKINATTFTFLLIILFALCGCNSARISPIETNSQPSPNENRVQQEELQTRLIENSHWILSNSKCPSEIFPEIEKEIEYLDEGCKFPVTCLDNCKNEDGNACYSLALFLQKHQEIDRKYSEALFLKSCEYGVISGCTNSAAGMADLNFEDKSAQMCAYETFEKTCLKGDSWGCTMYAHFLTTGEFEKQDLDKALRILEKSCKFGVDDPACQAAEELKKQILEATEKSKKDGKSESSN